MNMQSENINELIGALAKAQGKIITAKKDKQNPYFKSSYADLSSIWDACRSALSENGLAVVQSVQVSEGKMELLTTLAHSSGQWMKSQMPILTVKSDPQSIGSALTYYRRYALAAIVGVAASEEDDDGNSASGRDDRNGKGHSPKTEPIQKPKIKQEQALELEEILDECDPTYKSKVMKSIGDMGFENLKDINEDLFNRVKTAALKKRETETLAMSS
jgi:hypothetical protein